MNAPFVVAQAITSGQSTARTTVKLTKPANGQAVSVQLDANTQLDFSAIAGDQITLVRVGNQLVILFDNQATVTIPQFFDANGNPLDTLAIDLGNNRIVDGQEFAGLFPITADRTILTAAGGAGGGGDGFGAGDPNVDPLNTGNPLDLLAGEDGPGITFSINEILARDNGEEGPVEPGPTIFAQTIIIDEDGDAPSPIFGLPGRLPGGPGDDPTAPLIYFGGPGISGLPAPSGPAFFNFGSDGPAAVDPIIYDIAALTALNLTSGGIPIVWTQVGDNLVGSVGPLPVDLVVGVTILDLTTGDFAVAMLRPLDHPAPASGAADETGYLIDIPLTLTDGNGTKATGTLAVNVNDDSPEQSFGFDEESGDPLPPDSGAVEEVSGLPLSDTVSLGILWGADNFNAGGTNDRSVTFADQGTLANNVAFTGSGPLTALTSNGVAIEYVLIGGVLVAYTGAVPGAVADSNVVFSVELSDVSGTFEFTLRGPLDHPAPDVASPTPQGTIPHFIDLTFSLTVTDSDGDSINATVTVNVDAAGVVRPSICGCWLEVDYSGLPGGVFINLSDDSRTEGTETADARTAQDREGVTPVVGIDQLGTDVLDAIGTDADDIIIGGDESNGLDGGGGDDLIRGGGGDDVIYGGAGSDTIRGGQGDDAILGEGGADTIYGGGGWDEIHGGAGADWIDGGSGSDFLTGDGGGDTIRGGTGDDRIEGGGGDDNLRGGGGDDDIFGDAGNDTIRGGGGDDYIEGNGGDDSIIYNVGQGADVVFGGGGLSDIQEIYGTDDVETYNINLISLPPLGDFVGINIESGFVPAPADDSNFEVATRGVEDIYIDTGVGPDLVIVSGSLNGTGLATSTIEIEGGDGDFTDGVDLSQLDSDHGVTFYGRGGDDILAYGTGGGDVTYYGGDGTDTIDFSFVCGCGGGIEIDLSLTVLQDTNYGLLLVDSVENVNGSGEADIITGNASANVLAGDFGDDTITGGLGDDTLRGDEGDDLIIYNVGDGVDEVQGGEGDELAGDTLEIDLGGTDDYVRISPDLDADPANLDIDID
ncbi:MAG TPA: hypothetical protein VJL90_14445, partial [Pseudorhodoplanes sp.]|nr:hypothetical protein [Pseudorhodoplanes sp.]